MSLPRLHCACYHFDMLSIGVGLTVHCDCLDTQLLGSSHDANGDFTSVKGASGDQYPAWSTHPRMLANRTLTCWQSGSSQTEACGLCAHVLISIQLQFLFAHTLPLKTLEVWILLIVAESLTPWHRYGLSTAFVVKIATVDNRVWSWSIFVLVSREERLCWKKEKKSKDLEKGETKFINFTTLYPWEKTCERSRYQSLLL